MGGGDLNTKKSWHPNTIKNQERVWKAEQAQAHEKQRINDLRKEINDERSREDLTHHGQSSGVLAENPNKKMDWMYKQPNESIDREQYLLGKAIDKTFEKIVTSEQANQSYVKAPPKNHVEHECIPFSIRNLTGNLTAHETQVDMARKMLEDPLVAIRKRELESRAQLLQNPVKLKELTMLLKEDQALRNSRKKKSKKNKKEHSDLDSKLAKKLKKLKNVQDCGLDLDDLLSTKGKSKKKKKKSKKSSDTDSDSDSDDDHTNKRNQSNQRYKRDSSFEKHELSKKKKKKNKKSDTDSDSDSDNDDHTNKSHQKNRRSKRDSSLEKNELSKKKKKKSKHSDSDNDKHRNKNLQNEKKSRRGTNTERNDESYGDNKNGSGVRHRKHDEEKLSKYDRKPYDKSKSDMSNLDVKKSNSHVSSSHKRSYEPSRRYNDGDDDDEPQTKHYGLVKADGSRIEITNSKQVTEPVKKTAEEKKWVKPNRSRLNEKEMEEKRREMMENATKRDTERERNVSYYRDQDKKREDKDKSVKYKEDFVEKHLRVAADHSSLEGRIKSNIYNIQRSNRHMDTNFAKR